MKKFKYFYGIDYEEAEPLHKYIEELRNKMSKYIHLNPIDYFASMLRELNPDEFEDVKYFLIYEWFRDKVYYDGLPDQVPPPEEILSDNGMRSFIKVRINVIGNFHICNLPNGEILKYDPSISEDESIELNESDDNVIVIRNGYHYGYDEVYFVHNVTDEFNNDSLYSVSFNNEEGYVIGSNSKTDISNLYDTVNVTIDRDLVEYSICDPLITKHFLFLGKLFNEYSAGTVICQNIARIESVKSNRKILHYRDMLNFSVNHEIRLFNEMLYFFTIYFNPTVKMYNRLDPFIRCSYCGRKNKYHTFSSEEYNCKKCGTVTSRALNDSVILLKHLITHL